MKTLGLLLITSLIAMASFRGVLAAEALPTELQVLDRWLGTWTMAELVSKQAEWTPQEIRKHGDITTTKTFMAGRYLEERTTLSPDGSEHLVIFSYDSEAKAYHFTYFGSAGDRLEFTLRWDTASQTMTGTAPLPNGVTMISTTRFPDANTKVWTLVAKDAAGKAYLDISARETRRTQ